MLGRIIRDKGRLTLWDQLPFTFAVNHTLRIMALAGLTGSFALPTSALTLTNYPTADTFVREAAPTANYGGAGSVSVSGSAAVNGSGTENGPADALLRFSMGGVVASLDSTYGAGGWTVSGATLRLTEQAAPSNPLYNRGTGSFEIRWVAANGWTEGTGTPNLPTTDGLSHDSLTPLLDPANDVSLGTFANAGLNTQQGFNLPLTDARFLADLAGAGDVNLYLTAVSPTIGFTFNSRSASATGARPFLELTVTAVPEPGAGSLILFGGLWLWRAGRGRAGRLQTSA